MSSLAQLADLTRDESLLRRVKAFYDNGLWEIRDALGWVIESTHPDADPDKGEVNNTGDIALPKALETCKRFATRSADSVLVPAAWNRAGLKNTASPLFNGNCTAFC